MKKAEAMEVADGSLGRIVYGTGNPTLDVLERISDHFGIEAWQLLSPDLGRAPGQTARANDEPSLANVVRETAAAYGRPRLSAENQQALQELVESTIRSAITLLPAQTETDLPTLNTAQKRIAITHGKVSTPEQLALLNRQLAKAANKPTRKPPAGEGRGKA